MSSLIIVESPTKARTLGRFLGKDFVVDSTMGHIRDLPKSKIGVDVDNNFEPTYVDDPKKAETVSRLKKEAAVADKVYLATDPDREGEAISWHTRHALHGNSKSETRNSKFLRVTFHEITEEAVKDAISHPRELDMNLVDAQQARRILDRLVGYKLSPILWKKVRKGLSAGRVQSVAVRLIVEKEREIEAFVPVEYWDVLVEVSQIARVPQVPQELGQDTHDTSDTLGARGTFITKLVRIGDKPVKIDNGEQAKKIVDELEKATYKVSTIEKKELTRKPFAPFTTSTMTQSASRTMYWSAKKTMSVAQKLYEEGLITYHRTDSTNIALQAIDAVRSFISKEYTPEYLPEKPKFYKTTSKSAQEAHEAIRPTDINSKFEILNSKLGSDAAKLYGLIWRRFVASQMTDSVFDQTTVSVSAKSEGNSVEYGLQVRGEVMKFPGWKALYNNAKSEAEEVVLLPDVKENEELQLVKVDPQQKFTQPPARFTEASLVKTLEKLGIGRPSTYAPTISTIQDRQYVEKQEGKFIPSSLGIAVNDFLMTNFSQEIEYNFTAEMEESLDKIATGEKKWIPVISDFWKPFSKKLIGVDKNAERVKVEVEMTGNKCPFCIAEDLPSEAQGDEVIRVGRFGKFLSCSRFPDCKYTAAYVEMANIKCPECGNGEIIIKKTRRGKKFFGCSNYPECKFASWKKPEVLASPQVQPTGSID